ncbi:uncharacterized protein LOC129592847 [Paramacrobiotus metropolitanus]|uniref:uncharacterized protein LOC129592847 n=1 Tax=Paramacrobiotus metropolitanus TaxID=2943436 RepID=UPI002446174F|nr:uncharacterized protein LOC129592847 [Paramacrobiotus metropolitanus]
MDTFAIALSLTTSVFGVINNTNVSVTSEGYFEHNSTDNPTPAPWYPLGSLYTEEQVREAYQACRAVFFCLLILCTVGNGLNLVVLIRSAPTWKTSACHYMIGAAVADLLALWLGLWMFWSDERINGNFGNRFDNLIIPWFSEATMCLSDWILVVFSWERLLVCLSVYRFGFLQRVVTARVLIVVLLVLSLACYSFEFVQYYFLYTHDFTSPVIIPDPWWVNEWRRINRLGLIVMRMLTFLLILIPSAMLILLISRQRRSDLGAMRRLQEANSETSVATSASKTSSGSSQHAINIILLSSALLYLITRAPKFFDLCASALPYDVDFIYVNDGSLNDLMEPIIVVTMYMGYSLNFYVYLLSESHYRRRFITLVARPVWSLCFPTKSSSENPEGQTEGMEMSKKRSMATSEQYS